MSLNLPYLEMKKSLSLFFFLSIFVFLSLTSPVFAGCDPPHDYSDCDELHPDLNINLLNPVPITGNLGLNDFWGGETDVNAPQLSTLINGNPNPNVTSLYQLHYWEWQTNQVGPLVPPPSNLNLNNYDFATLVGFSTQPGQAILVPNSGYDIGQGNEVMILYATENSLVLKYTGDDNVNVGYTFYLNNFQVDPQLLAYYNRLNEAGRVELPVLMAGMKIGEALSNEILVAIRDTGSFMDPRWFYAWWWLGLDPQLLELILMAFPAGSTFAPPANFCTPSRATDLDSRPADCDACNIASNFCPSCATTFTVHDMVEYKRGDGEDVEPYCVEKDWGGIVSIDPTNTTIPFVGKKGSESEEKYLADYFEGTNEYYNNYGAYFTEWINHAGVLRKLTPLEYQNQLKKEMVQRVVDTEARNAHEEGIHDYELDYLGRRCWDAPFWLDAVLTAAKRINPGTEIAAQLLLKFAHYCVFEDNSVTFELANLIPSQYRRDSGGVSGKTLTDFIGHLPPDQNEEDYVEKWQEWQESEGGIWSRLWSVVPLVSREDTPGDINPYLGFKSKDLFSVINPGALIEKLPHVARLYESTQKVQNMLLPTWDEGLMLAQKQTTAIIASAQENVLGEKTERSLLAQTELPASASLVLMSQGCVLKPLVEVGVCAGGGNAYHYVGDCGITMANIFTIPCGAGCVRGDPQCPSINLSSLTEGQTVTSCVHIEMIEVENCQGIRNTTVCCSVTKTGPNCDNYESDCTIGPELPEGVCGINGPMPVRECNIEAITDVNENDKICGEEILIDLKAVDTFENWEKPKCETEGITCKTIDGCIPTATNDCQTCKDPCEETIAKGVSREVGIDLSHPYLTKIWEQTGLNETSGLFNIFRPASWQVFKEIDAASEIVYGYHGGVTPPTGRFYFNYLGGVQLAKEWITKILLPNKEQLKLF